MLQAYRRPVVSVSVQASLQNAGFLDYRIPVASDLPMIDTEIVEVPNPGHPYGVRGVGETSICPPLAAIANAVSNAAGVRLTELPMSPPRILKALDDVASGKTWRISCGGHVLRLAIARCQTKSHVAYG